MTTKAHGATEEARTPAAPSVRVHGFEAMKTAQEISRAANAWAANLSRMSAFVPAAPPTIAAEISATFAGYQKLAQSVADSTANLAKVQAQSARALEALRAAALHPAMQRFAQQVAEQEASDTAGLIADSEALAAEVSEVLEQATADGFRRLALLALKGNTWAVVRVMAKAARGNATARRVLALGRNLLQHSRRIRLHLARTYLRGVMLRAIARAVAFHGIARAHAPAPPYQVLLLGSVSPCAP